MNKRIEHVVFRLFILIWLRRGGHLYWVVQLRINDTFDFYNLIMLWLSSYHLKMNFQLDYNELLMFIITPLDQTYAGGLVSPFPTLA